MCVFNNNYLIKIGGYNRLIKDENNLYLELYDIKNNKWHEITQIEYSTKPITALKPVRTYNSGVIQLSSKPNTIFVFSGKEAINE